MASKVAALRKPRVDDRRIYEAAFGMFVYPALFLAHKLKLFSLLDKGPQTLGEVATALGLASRPAEALLSANAALGFVKPTRGRYALTPTGETYLVDRSPTFWGPWLDFWGANSAAWSLQNLEKSALSDTGQGSGGSEWITNQAEQEKFARDFTRAIHSLSLAPALAWPEKVNLSRQRVMLDVGGGSGVHSIGATLKWPKLRAVVFELASACEVAQEFAAKHGLQQRITTHAGDMWNDPFPPADVHFYSHVFHDWAPDKCRVLSRKSFESLEPGGRIILHEGLFNPQKTGPFGAAAMTMTMLAWTQGRQYTARELSDMLREAGFKDIKVRPTFGYMSIVTGAKA